MVREYLMSIEDIHRCPVQSWDNLHYRPDGSCRCDEQTLPCGCTLVPPSTLRNPCKAHETPYRPGDLSIDETKADGGA